MALVEIRKFFLLGIITSLLLWTTGIEYSQQQEKSSNINTSKFFAIQHSQSGSISKINEFTYSLELNDVSDKTILYSNRPDIIVTSISTSDFVDNLGIGTDSFAVDAQNAGWVIGNDEVEETIELELFNPIYSLNEKTLKYYIDFLKHTSINIPNDFGQSTLLVDSGLVN